MYDQMILRRLGVMVAAGLLILVWTGVWQWFVTAVILGIILVFIPR